MPRVNWYLSPEAKAIFEAYKLENGLGQDDAANALLLDFQAWRRYAEYLGWTLPHLEWLYKLDKKPDSWNSDAHFCKEDADAALKRIRESKL